MALYGENFAFSVDYKKTQCITDIFRATYMKKNLSDRLKWYKILKVLEITRL